MRRAVEIRRVYVQRFFTSIPGSPTWEPPAARNRERRKTCAPCRAPDSPETGVLLLPRVFCARVGGARPDRRVFLCRDTVYRLGIETWLNARESGLGVTSIAACWYKGTGGKGHALQSLSRALKEEVRFTESRITSADWGTYPILTFSDAPEMDARTSRRRVRGSLPPSPPRPLSPMPSSMPQAYGCARSRLRRSGYARR